jgi:hypothetical protein
MEDIVISKKIVLILSLCVAGSLVPLQAAPCVSGSLLSTYIGNSCNIGSLTFSFSDFHVVADGTSTTPVGGLTAGDVQLVTLLNGNGTGFLLVPTVAWQAIGGGTHTDSELTYIVSGTGINSIYLEVDGNVTPNAFNHVLEQYCLGGVNSPPAGDGSCPGDINTLQHQLDATIVGVGGPGDTDGSHPIADGCSGLSVAVTPTGAGPLACGVSASFGPQTSISVLKDIDVNGGPGGGSGDFAQITGVVNQFGPAVPEPGTYVMSALGLGLVFLGKRRLSRS